MSKYNKLFLLFGILIAGVLMYNSITVNATSWVKLKPEEVDRKAEVIVLGRYNISSFENSEMYNSVYYPIKFTVSKYYRGSGAAEIATGIDMLELEAYKKQQDNGEEFLLFFERAKENKDVLIPIAGPNGTIEILNGKVKNRDADEEAYYANILSQTSTEPAQDFRKIKEIIVIGFAVLLICAIIILRKLKIWQVSE